MNPNQMKTFWLTISTAVFLLLSIYGSQAQETVAASGANATGNGGSASYTIGQTAYTINTGTSGTIIQGVQQPYEIFSVTNTEENEMIGLEMMVYPNPASDFLKLTIVDNQLENLTYQLIDIHGSLIRNGKINDGETVIPTGSLAPAEYYLKVTSTRGELKVFKIIKN